MMEEILSIQNFSFELNVNDSKLPILDDINFQIFPKEIVSLVGESGCGKTVCSLAITKLLPDGQSIYKHGKMLYKKKNLLQSSTEQLQEIRGKEISYIFQDPFSSLNPLKKIKDQMIESYILHISKNKKTAIEKAKFLLDKVGISDLEQRLNSYPNQLSGGLLQRISIAMALMCDPSLLIADEPTSALDVTVQAQLVELLYDLKEHMDMSVLFISHDLALVASISNKISVMYAGQIVETGLAEEVIQNPLHPYTRALLKSIPALHTGEDGDLLEPIPGVVPTPDNYPTGCRFFKRCKVSQKKCCDNSPPTIEHSNTQSAKCFLLRNEK